MMMDTTFTFVVFLSTKTYFVLHNTLIKKKLYDVLYKSCDQSFFFNDCIYSFHSFL